MLRRLRLAGSGLEAEMGTGHGTEGGEGENDEKRLHGQVPLGRPRKRESDQLESAVFRGVERVTSENFE